MKKQLFYIQVLTAMIMCFDAIATSLPRCPSQEQRLPLSSQTYLGFSGEELLANIRSNHGTVLRWANGPRTNVFLTFSPADGYVTQIIPGRRNNCVPDNSKILIDGILSFQTQDGRVNAQWHVQLWADSADKAYIEFSRSDSEDLQGIPGPGECEFIPETYFRFKFHRDQRDGTINRIFGRPDPEFCGDETPPSWIGDGAEVATIGHGVPRHGPM